ncbi:MAG: killer suppression protein [Candidatus Anammoximicrobium sp.]|nr:killer suppression protein [Candidatus Anammoximicrobium sp.]
MQIWIASRKLAKLFNSQEEMRAKLGPRCAQLLQQRLEELQAAATLEDMGALPTARCHEMKANRKSQLALDLDRVRWLVFEPVHRPVPSKHDDRLDWSMVTEIVIREVIDHA